jgi:hypothetical protein
MRLIDTTITWIAQPNNTKFVHVYELVESNTNSYIIAELEMKLEIWLNYSGSNFHNTTFMFILDVFFKDRLVLLIDYRVYETLGHML